MEMTETFDYFLSKPRELGIGLGLFLSIVSGIFGYIFPFKKFKCIPAMYAPITLVQAADDNSNNQNDQGCPYASNNN